jgi:menaquinol-cytochrome c reductase iron-sulfur subunit
MGENDLSRRNFMIRTIIGIFVLIGAAMTAALGGFGVLPALKKKEPAWSDAGSVADLQVNQPQERRFFETVKSGWQKENVERTVWLVKKPDNSVTAYSPNCPHLGCGYRWVAADQRFACPCHGSVFDINGKVLSGPAPRPLDTIETRVEGGKLLVKFETFQLGISMKMLA